MFFPKHKNIPCTQAGRKAVGLDIRMGEALDITSTKGFVQHLYQTCRLEKGSGFLAAPVCSTFVFMRLCYIHKKWFSDVCTPSNCWWWKKPYNVLGGIWVLGTYLVIFRLWDSTGFFHQQLCVTHTKESWKHRPLGTDTKRKPVLWVSEERQFNCQQNSMSTLGGSSPSMLVDLRATQKFVDARLTSLPGLHETCDHLPSPYTNAGLWGTNGKRHLALLRIPASTSNLLFYVVKG